MLAHNKDSGGGRRLNTNEYVVKLCEQVLTLLACHSAEAMTEVPGGWRLSCALTDTDRATANDCREVKNTRKAKDH